MKEIAAALVKAQRAFGPALKTSSNPHFKSRYADVFKGDKNWQGNMTAANISGAAFDGSTLLLQGCAMADADPNMCRIFQFNVRMSGTVPPPSPVDATVAVDVRPATLLAVVRLDPSKLRPGDVPVSIDGRRSVVRSGNADHFSSIDHLIS